MPSNKTLMPVLLAACMASVGVAQDSAQKQKGNKAKQKATELAYKQLLKPFERAELTDKQVTEAKQLLEPSLDAYIAAKKTFNKVLTKDQATELREARKKVWADGLRGKDGKEAQQAAFDALSLPDEKAEQYHALKADLDKITGKLKESVMSLLTDQQKEAMPGRKGKGGKGKKGKKKNQQ